MLSSVLNSLFVGELFAQAPIDQYPGIAVETVTDSSRYFVIRIQDGTGELSMPSAGVEDTQPDEAVCICGGLR